MKPIGSSQHLFPLSTLFCKTITNQFKLIHSHHFLTSTHITTPNLLKPSPWTFKLNTNTFEKNGPKCGALWTCPCKPFRSNVRARDLKQPHNKLQQRGGKASLNDKGDALRGFFPLDFQVFFFQMPFLTRITRQIYMQLKIQIHFSCWIWEVYSYIGL